MKTFEKFMTHLKSAGPSEEGAIDDEDAGGLKNVQNLSRQIGDEPSVDFISKIAYHRQLRRTWKAAKSAVTEGKHTSIISQAASTAPLIEFLDVPAWSVAQQITFLDQSLIQATPLVEFRVWADKADVERGKMANLCSILDLYKLSSAVSECRFC